MSVDRFPSSARCGVPGALDQRWLREQVDYRHRLHLRCGRSSLCLLIGVAIIAFAQLCPGSPGMSGGVSQRDRVRRCRRRQVVAGPCSVAATFAEAAFANIQRVGIPQWTDADQTLAKALQKGTRFPRSGYDREGGSNAAGPRRNQYRRRVRRHRRHSWNVPTITLRSRPTSPDCPDITGRTRSPWQPRSPTKGQPPARRCRR